MKISFKQLKQKGYQFYYEGNKLIITREERIIVEIATFTRSQIIITKEYAILCDNSDLEISIKRARYGYRMAIKTKKSKNMKILYKEKWFKYKNSGMPFFPELPSVTMLLHI